MKKNTWPNRKKDVAGALNAIPHLVALVHAREAINYLESAVTQLEQKEPNVREAWRLSQYARDAAVKFEEKMRDKVPAGTR